MPNSNDRISFAHNARTLCIAFVAFASRYYYGNIKNADLNTIFSLSDTDNSSDSRLYDIFSNIEDFKSFVPQEIFNKKDTYDNILDQLFNIIIESGTISFLTASRYDSSLNATNYLKKDKNYYTILSDHWHTISLKISKVFDEIQ